jgi:hypothetical protein
MMSALGLSDANAASRKLQEKGLDAASAETTVVWRKSIAVLTPEMCKNITEPITEFS